MAAKSRSEIIADFEDYIGRSGGVWREWCVGVTGAPKARLFDGHKVKEKGDAWICRLAKDEHDAHDVAEYFVSTRKTKGKPGSLRESDLYVYAFKMKSHTRM